MDETLGLPIDSEIYPRRLDCSSETVKTIISLTILVMKANFPLDVGSILEISSEQIPTKWSSLADYRFGYFSEQMCELEFRIVQNIALNSN